MHIDTVLFDMGGTLEEVVYDSELRLEASKGLLDYLKTLSVELDISYQQFAAVLEHGYNEYKSWSLRNNIEAKPDEIWPEWLLKDFQLDREKIEKISESLSVFWETRFYKRKCRDETHGLLKELKGKGYKLGIISNTTSRTQVFGTLKDYGIDNYFSCVCLSSITGRRKPDVSMFYEALERIGSSPEKAAYVGDQLSRDVVGSKAAGYAISILIESFFTDNGENRNKDDLHKIDYRITNLMEVADILDKINASGC